MNPGAQPPHVIRLHGPWKLSLESGSSLDDFAPRSPERANAWALDAQLNPALAIADFSEIAAAVAAARNAAGHGPSIVRLARCFGQPTICLDERISLGLVCAPWPSGVELNGRQLAIDNVQSPLPERPSTPRRNTVDVAITLKRRNELALWWSLAAGEALAFERCQLEIFGCASGETPD